MKKILFILSAFLFLSCSSNDIRQQLTRIKVDEATIPSVLTLGETTNITIKYTLVNDCISFLDLFYEQQGNSRVIAVIALKDVASSCAQVITQREFTFPLTVTQKDDYIFKLWKGKDSNGLNIFEEVKVPVN